MTGSRKEASSEILSESGSYKLIPQLELPPRLKTEPAESDHHVDIAPLEQLLQDGDLLVTPRHKGQEFLDSSVVQISTVLLILSNAIVIGLETDLPNLTHWDIIENAYLVVFSFELALRIKVQGIDTFFDWENQELAWNVFDFFIVCFGILSSTLTYLFGSAGLGKDATLFRVARLLRILRVLRIIRIVRFLKQLYLLAYGFMEGTMAVFWVSLLASFMLYICAVVLVRTYGHGTSPGHIPETWERDHEFFEDRFGTIPRTMFALFELIAAPELAPYKEVMFEYPALVFFLVTFIVLGSFGINGLLVALINESILEKNQARLEAERIEREAKRKLMQTRCREVFDAIDVNNNRVLPREDIMRAKGQIARLFESAGVNFRSHDLDQMFYIMDYNDTGIIEKNEFVQGVVELCDQIRPMSIMELHYQVSKCATKIGECDLKMDSISKTVEDLFHPRPVNPKQVETIAHALLDRHRQLMLTEQGSTGTSKPSILKKSGGGSSVASRSDSARKAFWQLAGSYSQEGRQPVQELLDGHQKLLLETHGNIETSGPKSTHDEHEDCLANVAGSLAALQRANADVMDAFLERLRSAPPEQT
eukprot:gnl/TRDRNA2_/TRDRNA2_125792_c0_seq1.p1 gnl/TRDRNA2_/TRDRNA2_125792_c0~~gnl/TRDRNA2_/TRDRNA2_125792_c0_seq1.p1  ORF type:complete len:593 (-),score=120.24 gnl/TRDRNA2_/TRDRNA2_125792_c0_seq1:22-1800(-)